MIDRFLDALKEEVGLYAEYGKRSEFETIFFGGGTPSLLAPRQIGSIMDLLHSTFRITADAEVTVETNPGTVDLEKLAAYRALGINRLSIGIQSFHKEELRFLGRIHTKEEALMCVDLARAAGFENISIDLIFSVPGQGLGRWKETLRQAVALNPSHISAYSLIVEDSTPLARMVSAGRIFPTPVDMDAEMYEFTMGFLDAHGFEHYEVSNYARPGCRSRHNYNYWSHRNYLGLGPSSHSFWKIPGETFGRRWWNIADVSAYCVSLFDHRLPVVSEEVVDSRNLISERILLGLRSDGVRLDVLHSDFGFDLLERQKRIIGELIKEKYAIIEDQVLRLTPRGYLLCDEICIQLTP